MVSLFLVGPDNLLLPALGMIVAALLLLRKPLESTADAQAPDDSDQKEETPLC